MGRHTAPIPVVGTSTALLPTGPVTDPHLFDRPMPPAATSRAHARAAVALQPGGRRTQPLDREHEDDGIDETPVRVPPRSVHSVLAAEEAAAAEELPPPRLPRARDLVFGGAALVVLTVAVGAALLP